MSLHEAHRIFLLPLNLYSGDKELRTITSYGHIDEFRAENESVKVYLEQIDIYFRANNIADEKKVLIFLSERKMYLVLRDLLAPVKPREKFLTS